MIELLTDKQLGLSVHPPFVTEPASQVRQELALLHVAHSARHAIQV